MEKKIDFYYSFQDKNDYVNIFDSNFLVDKKTFHFHYTDLPDTMSFKVHHIVYM